MVGIKIKIHPAVNFHPFRQHSDMSVSYNIIYTSCGGGGYRCISCRTQTLNKSLQSHAQIDNILKSDFVFSRVSYESLLSSYYIKVVKKKDEALVLYCALDLPENYTNGSYSQLRLTTLQ